jgi:hypothetical protein
LGRNCNAVGTCSYLSKKYDWRIFMFPEIPNRTALDWRKATASANNGACIEVAPAGGYIAVRDSKDPDGTWLRYPAQSWNLFVRELLKIEQKFE